MIDLIQEIFGTIKRNKLRTFLTGFAVAWGIFMLIVLLGAGNGLIHAFESSSADMAINSIKVFPGWTSKAYDGLKEGRRIELDNKDYRITETDFPKNVISVGATVRQSNVTLTYGQDYVSTSWSKINHVSVISQIVSCRKERHYGLSFFSPFVSVASMVNFVRFGFRYSAHGGDKQLSALVFMQFLEMLFASTDVLLSRGSVGSSARMICGLDIMGTCCGYTFGASPDNSLSI